MNRQDNTYREEEDSVVFHAGNYYSVNQLLEAVEQCPKYLLNVQLFAGHIIPADLDQKRIEAADTSKPIIYCIDPVWGYVVLDGAHRVAKVMLKNGYPFISGKEIPHQRLKPINKGA